MKKRIFAILLSALLCVGFLSGCGTGNTNDVSGSSAENESAENETSEKDLRIVVLSAAECEILYSIGAGDYIVGRGEYCDYPAEVLEVPAVSSGAETNLEEVLALEPDFVFQSYMAQSLDGVKKMEEAGIKVVEGNATTIEEVYEEIQNIGKELGLSENADRVVKEMKETLDSVKKEVSDSEKKTIYFEVSPLQYGLWAAGKNTFMNEVAELMGLKNCFDDLEGWKEISEEQVLERNPDYIVSLSMYTGEGLRPEEEIFSRKGWENVEAVKNKKVLLFENNEMTRPSPRICDGAKALFDFVYGE